MLAGFFFHCFRESIASSSLTTPDLGANSPQASQAKPLTRPSASWQAAGLDGIDEVVKPRRDNYPMVLDGWDTMAAQRVIVKRYACVATANREMALTRDLDHPHLIHATRLALAPDSSSAITVAPLAVGQPLARAGVLVGFQRVLFDCLDGLAYLHRQGVLHNDLHHENIITDGHAGYIIDFDASRRSTAMSGRNADLTKLLMCFTSHVPDENRAAFDIFCGSRLIRRWGSRIPTHAQLRRVDLFLSIRDATVGPPHQP